MARRKESNVNPVSLDELIPQFAEHKETMDGLKKVCEAENAKIKELMNNSGEHTAGGYKASISVSTRENVDEDKMLAKLKIYNEAYDLGIIQTKEYIDTDALEAAIYKKEVPDEILSVINSCRSSKDVVTLRVTKVEEGKVC